MTHHIYHISGMVYSTAKIARQLQAKFLLKYSHLSLQVWLYLHAYLVTAISACPKHVRQKCLLSSAMHIIKLGYAQKTGCVITIPLSCHGCPFMNKDKQLFCLAYRKHILLHLVNVHLARHTLHQNVPYVPQNCTCGKQHQQCEDKGADRIC